MVGFVTEPRNCVGEYFARQLAWSSVLGSRSGGTALVSMLLLNFADVVLITLPGMKK